MKNRTLRFAFLFIGVAFYLSSCQSDLDVASTITSSENTYIPLFSDEDIDFLNEKFDMPNGIEYNYSIDLPDHVGGNLLQMDNVAATLGRILFYDKALSIDHTTSCATCHLQEAAFAENLAVSVGLNDELGSRNSIALGSFISMRQQYYGGAVVAIATNNKFFWDERASTIHEQMVEAIESPIEMGMEIDDLVARVAADPHYQLLFKKTFSDGEINSTRIFRSIQTFMSTIHSTNSYFDNALDNMPTNNLNVAFTGFTSKQNQGKELFLQNCKTCHGNSLTPAISATVRVANTGLDLIYDDGGVGSITNNASSLGKFKVPSLKNVEVTYPYMHDGRFETLEDVVDFYSEGIQSHPNLASQLKNSDGTPKKFNFTNSEKAALVDFLKTLTDPDLLTDPKFSDPFKY